MDTAAIAVIASTSATVLVALIGGIWGPARQERVKAEQQKELDIAARQDERDALRYQRAEEFGAALLQWVKLDEWAAQVDAEIARIRFVATLRSGEGEIADKLRISIAGMASAQRLDSRQHEAAELMQDLFAYLQGDISAESFGR